MSAKPEKSPIERRITRQKRVQTILRYLGYSSPVISIPVALIVFKNGQPVLATLTAFVSIGLVFLAMAAKLFSELIDAVLDRIEKKLEQQVEPLANSIVDGLEEVVVKGWWQLTSNFQGKYYQQLIYACRDYKTYGLKTRGEFTLDFEKIFVPLRISPEISQVSQGISPEMICSNAGKGGLTIWDFLVASRSKPQFRCLAIIGGPGSGKTTILKDLTLTYAQNRQRRQHRQAPKLIPILLYLRDVRNVIAEKQPSLATLIEKQPSISKLKPRQGRFEEILRHRNCLVMLDGLDELADEQQRKVVSKWINEQINSYQKARFILTSRLFGYLSTPVEGVKTILDVQPFNLSQMEQFIQNWYLQKEIMSRLGKDDPKVRQEAKRQSDDLIERIKNNSALVALALNPLLLTMIATVHLFREALPGKRVELYAEICDVLLEKRDEARGISIGLTPEQEKAVLQVLALELMESKTCEFSLELGRSLIEKKLADVAGSELKADDFFKNIETRNGLLVARQHQVYEFAHKSFQEYLAAVQIKELNQESLLISQINDSWWEETIRLYAALMDATNLIKAALEHPEVISLKLALDCCDEGLSVNAQVRENLSQDIEKRLESDEADEFKLAAEVQLARRVSNLVRIDENLEIDDSYVTCAEYQLFINNQQRAGLQIEFPESWQGDRFPPGDAQKPVRGISWQNANRFCAWLSQHPYHLTLTSLLTSLGNLHYRLPTEQEKLSILHYGTEGDEWLGETGISLVGFPLPSRYGPLAYLLACYQWREADEETRAVMLEVANRESRGYLDEKDFDNFPCEDLRTIDQLWVYYSKGRFGFSVQKDIYLGLGGTRLGGTRKYNKEIWIEFCDRVGWRKRGRWLSYSDLTFELRDPTPRGHLPCSASRAVLWMRRRDGVSSLAYRIVKCSAILNYNSADS